MPSPTPDTIETQPILTKSSDSMFPVEAVAPPTKEEQEILLDDSIVFLRRIQSGIYLLGWELGFLVQASTADIQYLATAFTIDRTSQLLLSLQWSFALALLSRIIFRACQKAIHIFMLESVRRDPNQNYKGNDKYQWLLDEWNVDLKCRFVHGSLWGVLSSWVFLDVLMNFRIRVIYGGILFLASLLLFLARLWRIQEQQQARVEPYLRSLEEEELYDLTHIHPSSSDSLFC